MAACFKRRRHYHLFLQVKRPVSLGGETGLFLSLGLWIGEDNNRWQLFWVPDAACGCGGYSEACAAIAASAIALGAASPVFASLPAVVSACLPLLEFACLVELGEVPLLVADEPVGCVVSVGCAEPEGGTVSVGFAISGEVALSAAAFASSYALQASS